MITLVFFVAVPRDRGAALPAAGDAVLRRPPRPPGPLTLVTSRLRNPPRGSGGPTLRHRPATAAEWTSRRRSPHVQPHVRVRPELPAGERPAGPAGVERARGLRRVRRRPQGYGAAPAGLRPAPQGYGAAPQGYGGPAPAYSGAPDGGRPASRHGHGRRRSSASSGAHSASCSACSASTVAFALSAPCSGSCCLLSVAAAAVLLVGRHPDAPGQVPPAAAPRQLRLHRHPAADPDLGRPPAGASSSPACSASSCRASSWPCCSTRSPSSTTPPGASATEPRRTRRAPATGSVAGAVRVAVSCGQPCPCSRRTPTPSSSGRAACGRSPRSGAPPPRRDGA